MDTTALPAVPATPMTASSIGKPSRDGFSAEAGEYKIKIATIM
jgi:hypothetical protein